MNARGTTLVLLASRAPGATVCPSEVARTLAAAVDADTATAEWRSLMPAVHAAVDELVDAGLVQLSWKGATMPTRSGPYRIGEPGSRPGRK